MCRAPPPSSPTQSPGQESPENIQRRRNRSCSKNPLGTAADCSSPRAEEAEHRQRPERPPNPREELSPWVRGLGLKGTSRTQDSSRTTPRPSPFRGTAPDTAGQTDTERINRNRGGAAHQERKGRWARQRPHHGAGGRAAGNTCSFLHRSLDSQGRYKAAGPMAQLAGAPGHLPLPAECRIPLARYRCFHRKRTVRSAGAGPRRAVRPPPRRCLSASPAASSNRITSRTPELAKVVPRPKVSVLLFWALKYFFNRKKDFKD